MKIAFFGSSLVSTHWNAAAPYYRGIVRALASRGHEITFYEPDVFDRQRHRDLTEPAWAEIVVYDPADALRMIESARGADLVVKASAIGANDELLEVAVLELSGGRTRIAFWDTDPSATLWRLDTVPEDSFRALIPRYDVVFTRGGGAPIADRYVQLGAQRCVPIYSAFDPDVHHPIDADARFEGALGYLANRQPEHDDRFEDMFLRAAALMPEQTCVLGGRGWDGQPTSMNVRYVGEVEARDQNAFNCSPRAVLYLGRDAASTTVFEAAGAGACLVTYAGIGIEQFLEPGTEVLVARTGDELAAVISGLTPERAREIGARAYGRVLRQHTYLHRALDVEDAVGEPTHKMKRPGMTIVVLGLSITSSWANGHASTYRGLLRELAERGHEVHFLERDVPRYATHREPAQVPNVRVSLYKSLDELQSRFAQLVRDADVVIVGSYVPDGIAVSRWVLESARGLTAFYDLAAPITLADLETGTCEYMSKSLVPLFGLYLSSTGGPTLRRIEREFGAKRAVPLYNAVDPAVYTPEPRQQRWELGYLGTYSADRQAALDHMLLAVARRDPEMQCVVAGPLYPAHIEWPANVERIEHLGPSQHRGFYTACGWALNLTRHEMIDAGWSPSVRLFEATACGVPIISDAWDGLDEVFEPGKEIVIAHDTDDVIRALHRSDGREIGERARARVIAAHTAAHRAAAFERYLQEAR